MLREAVANKLPDVTFQGLNRQALMVDKGIAKSLEPFIAKEADFAKEGYHKAMLTLGTFTAKFMAAIRGVAAVGYYNMTALKKAGITELPKTWDDVIATAANCVKPDTKTRCSGAGTSQATGSSRLCCGARTHRL